ncbi:hypothetical protein J40TS1_41500 [Paenibacillus montaniterrae]|uniref:ANTAR domain-containing protein n=1 Tax=Paenibacillus montaniterrae TaxID=429341 RepID=A0A919YR19_9BACL|nr:ANTAR domain-containing protein [Paenibacillus montaniterrae]GIP18508.1 hypothetical protein J40TS1_41500 [Paenibacillus montaniterrae]
MRSILLISGITFKLESIRASEAILPIDVLERAGYLVTHAESKSQAKQKIEDTDVILLNLSLEESRKWGHQLMQWKRLPLLWWCSEHTCELSKAFCDSDLFMDGLITPAMNEQELHWALYFATKQCFERQQWLTERKMLEEKIEERKWIDIAKGILCKTKKISEAEAYDMLRKQAMNERKRLVDVAASIVKVYQLLEK